MAASDRLTAFFDPSTNGRDPAGRSLDDVLGWRDKDLEYHHDYIQNLFPLPEGSMFNSANWLVTEEAYDAFRAQPELRHSLERAFSRICYFYGLKNEATPQHRITPADHFAEGKWFWLTRFNHNHLRITRIIRSLRVLGLPEQAAAFWTFLSSDSEVRAKVAPRSLMYWERAANRPLHLPPDEDDEQAEGITWLRNKN